MRTRPPSAAQPFVPYPLARQTNLVEQPIADEVMIYDLDRHKVHLLNETAAAVWRMCDGRTPPEGMAARLAETLDPPVSDCEALVKLALVRLAAARLLEGDHAASVAAETISRRAVLKRVGIATLLPVVLTLAAPTIAETMSNPIPLPTPTSPL